MWDWITGVAYYAHGYCLSWDPWLIAAHASSDLLIFTAYTAIPIAILLFVRQRPDLEMKGLARFFAAFIFWCGLTHLTALATLWFPIYDIEAVVKIVTAAISIPTAVLIFFLIPKALAVPSPKDLQIVNGKLRQEISAHETTLAELRFMKGHLEEQVLERTRSLEEAAKQSKALALEVAHRSGNLMSVIAAMARMSSRSAQDPQKFAAALSQRIEALGRSQDLLFKTMWRDVDLATLISSQIDGFLGERDVTLRGPAVKVDPAMAHYVGMAFYELAANSLSFGALSAPTGRITINWSIDGSEPETLHLDWEERGGPPVRLPRRRGWGSAVIQHLAIKPLQGEVEIRFEKEGLRWSLTAPLVQGVLGRKEEKLPDTPINRSDSAEPLPQS